MTFYAMPLRPTPAQPEPVRVEWISESYNLFKANPGVWILAVIVAGAINLVVVGGWFIGVGLSWFIALVKATPTSGGSPFGGAAIYHDPTYLSLIIGSSVLGLIMSSLLSGGFFIMANKSLRGERPAVADLFAGMRFFFGMAALWLIMMIPGYISQVATILLLGATATPIGSIIHSLESMLISLVVLVMYPVLAVFVMPAMPLVADGVGVGEALQRSQRQMAGVFWPAVGMVILVYLIVTASSCACLVGLLVTVPMFYLICSIAARERLGLPVAGRAGDWPPSASYPRPAGVWPPPPTQPGASTFADWRTTTPPNVWPPPAQGAPPAGFQPPVWQNPPNPPQSPPAPKPGDNPPDKPGPSGAS